MTESNAYRNQAITVYQRVLKEFPNYDRAPEITFILALNLMETGKHTEGVAYFNTLLKKWPESRFTADVYMQLGDYYFNANQVNAAISHYENAVRSSRKIYMDPKVPDDRKVPMRGIHLRSLYFLAWCDFNVGEYERSLRRFKRVIELSTRYAKTKESRVLLKSEALRDLIRTFAKMNTTVDAYAYFRQVMGPKYAYEATRRLAGYYYRQGNYVKAIDTYRHLMTISVDGQKDDYGPEVPILQNEIVRAATRIWEPTKIYEEVLKMVDYFEDDKPWAKRWKNQEKIWQEAQERVEQTLLEFSTRYHQTAQDQEQKNPKRSEQFFDFSIRLYEQYLRHFPKTESAYELRFFWAELLYRKAEKIKGTQQTLPPESSKKFARAARQYQIVVDSNPQGQYRKQAAFAEVLCYEHLAGRTGGAELRGAGRKLEGLTKDPKTGQVSWKKTEIKKGSWDDRLLNAYQRYLKIVTGSQHNEDRLQTFFKTGTIYYSYRHYLEAMNIFSQMAREFPDHELSRRAAFMILYSYEDLNQWKELEENARLFLRDKVLTANAKFKQEMFLMLIRSSFLRIHNEKEEQKLVPLQLAKLYENYEKEFGKDGTWTSQQGFSVSPASDRALALSGVNYSEAQRILEAIVVRERLVKLYPESTFREQIIFEIGSHYEQIADYAASASWFERYVFGNKDYMKADSEDDAVKTKRGRGRKTTRKPPAKRGRRAASKQQAKDLQADKQVVDEKKVEQQKNNALYKAAAYRRGLGELERAIVLYRHFVKKFPNDKEVPELYLAIAEIYRELKQWDRALAASNEYLSLYQPDTVTKYLQSALRLQKTHLDKTGIFTRHIVYKPEKGQKQRVQDPTVAIRSRLGTLKPKDVANGQLLLAHVQIALIYEKLNQIERMEERYMMVDALGYQMYNLRAEAMHGLSAAREAYAQAKFYLAERRRREFEKLQFVGNSSKDRRMLKEIISGGRVLAADYAEVANMQSPKWVLAAVFRMGEIYHLFVKKLYAAPMPRDLPQRLWPEYKMALENFAANFEEIALEAYGNVLTRSAELGLYNEWVRRCEDARNEINRRQGSINPHTIFSQREQNYWLLEPALTEIRSTLLSIPKKATPDDKEPPKKATPDDKEPPKKATPDDKEPPKKAIPDSEGDSEN
jgi:tetratricopeptide (TPR) repeat protein